MKKSRKRECFKRKKKVSRIPFFIFAGSFFIACILLLLGNIRTAFRDVSYPSSALSGSSGEHLVKTYEDLKEVISFGDTFLCIPSGEVILVTESVFLLKSSGQEYLFFKHSDSESIEASFKRISEYLGKKEIHLESSDQGYQNGILVIYSAGVFSKKKKEYFVAYRLTSGEETLDILITASNEDTLKHAKEMLEHMVDTMVFKNDFEEKTSLEPVDKDGKDGLETVDDNSASIDVSDTVYAEYPYEESVPILPIGVTVPVDTIATKDGEKLFRIQHVTTDLSLGDSVYLEISLFFPVSEKEFSYFDSNEGECYLVSIDGMRIDAITCDTSFNRVLTYVFLLPNRRIGEIQNYMLVMKDPKGLVEQLYLDIRDAKSSPYSEAFDAEEAVIIPNFMDEFEGNKEP